MVCRLPVSDIFHLVINKLDSDSIRTAEHNNNGMKLNCGGGKESTKCRYVAVHRWRISMQYPQASAALVRCLNIPLNIDKLKRVLFRLDSYYWKISLEHLRSLFLKQKTPSIISASSLTCTGSLFGLWVQWLLHKWLQVVMLRRQPDPEISGFGTEWTWKRLQKSRK